VHDGVEHELRSALAQLEEHRDRPYYEAEADTAARADFYSRLDPEAPPVELLHALGALLEAAHRPRPSYKPSQHVYPWVDLHPDRRLRSIYSGRPVDPEEFIRADAEIAHERAARVQALAKRDAAHGARRFEAVQHAVERELPFNCEHVVPQSWFSKREPMRGDLHHLFACESHCNSLRGSTPYTGFSEAQDMFVTDCGRSEPAGFEPVTGKGPVARATLYFLLRYPGQIGDESRELQRAAVPLLLDWHRADPVADYERHRNAAVAESQGNRNPLIDFPEWAPRIDFEASLSR
jgi:endonuclease G, mitochondrial